MDMRKEDYYIGLDIGTNSVGWAVTDESYKICKHGKKHLWGIRLFESGKQAAERRLHRATRRRLARRKARIDLLQELFAEEMAKIDNTFFIRLNESNFHIEDKSGSERFPLFIAPDYTDIDYYKEYPTIYHLRKELIESCEPHDIRLVYLAIHHILKNRGHFLIDGDLKAATDFSSTFDQMMTHFNGDVFPFDLKVKRAGIGDVREILKSSKAKSVKAREIKMFFEYSDEESEEKKRKVSVENLCKLMCGHKADIEKVFYRNSFDALEKTSFSLAEQHYEEKILPILQDNYPDHAVIVESIKTVYDWSVLSDVLSDKPYLSEAKVEQYEKHKKDLRILRRLVKKYCSLDAYRKFFNGRSKGVGYSNYIGIVKKNGKKYSVEKCKEEEFYKKVKSLLSNVEYDDSDKKDWEYLKTALDSENLLPLQRSKENSVIPQQVNLNELEKILENASKYLTFLTEKDQSGLSVKQKVIELFRFRIPYYVGPLSNRHQHKGANQWIQRKKKGRIYPWNFDDIVDKSKSNEEFILRMTNKCTYLIGEDVLPKNSLLYARYMVLNELNNLKIRNNRIDVTTKQAVFNDLFTKKQRVTGKTLLSYLQKNDPHLRMEDLSGFDQDFKANLKSQMDFEKQIFGNGILNDADKQIIENIIRWSTIYGSDAQMVRKEIDKIQPKCFADNEIKKILRLNYSGWGNFSEKFLTGIQGVDKETGRSYSIIQALWETNDNLMQLLGSKYTFKEEIEKLNSNKQGKIKNITYDSLVKDLRVAPAIKRAIWQTIQITEELRHIQKGIPKKIFIEMARGEEAKKARTVSRKNKLLELYKGCEKDSRNWYAEIDKRDEREFNSIKLFLYYTQLGRDMYTGEVIDLAQLMSGNSKWDRDHIYPQSKVKDDSLDNLVLVSKVENKKKNNNLISSKVQSEMRSHWQQLLQMGLISKNKFDRLTRSQNFSIDELTGFIARQLVETRQSTKIVANLLKRIYPESEIVYVKSRLISDFRHEELGMPKSRRLNDYHHAKDAYLSIVVGNVYNAKFTSDPRRWIAENKGEGYNVNKIFYHDIYDLNGNCVWYAPPHKGRPCTASHEIGGRNGNTMDLVRDTMKRKDILYTEYTYCETGKLFDVTIKKKGAKSATVPIKAGMEIEKYGGYDGAKTSYFAMIERDDKRAGRLRSLVGVPIYIANRLEFDPNAFIKYCENIKGYKNIRVICNGIQKNALLNVGGFPMRIRGENENNILLKGNLQLVLGTKYELEIQKIESFFRKDSNYTVDPIKDGFNDSQLNELYDVLIEKLSTAYQKRPANPYEKLAKKKSEFISLSLNNKAVLINEILTLFRCDNKSTANLSCIEEGTAVGAIAINRNTISNKMKIIVKNQSITGVYENRYKL